MVNGERHGAAGRPFAVHHSLLLRLGWLFPLTYAAHVLEEWRGGDGFPAWFSRLTGAGLTEARFLALNEAALVGMAVGVALAYAVRELRWLLVSFAAAVTINGLAHLTATLATRTYSPGVVTGTLVWLPLGATVLAAGRRALSRRAFAAGLVVGVVLHAAVLVLAFAGR
jgi:hypothetical protein